MADWKQHAEDCHEILGNHWICVHQWLDELAKIYWPAKIHRVHRHNLEGIEIVRKKWGDEAAKAAMIHILTDEGKIMSQKEINKAYKVADKPKGP